jgi:septum site-determining protein MinC
MSEVLEKTTSKVSFQLKGSLFTLSVLQLNAIDLEQIDTDITAKIELAPKFFNHAPIVIDLSTVENIDATCFAALKLLLENHGLVPVGVRGAPTSLHEHIRAAGFAVFTDSTNTEKTLPPRSKTPQKEIDANPHKATAEIGTRLITTPIRSGQQVYAQGGDLIVTAPVSPGAELLADGNIHVYGSLKGRALAGINGNINARIFCSELDAELIAIAGHYKVLESTPAHLRKQNVQVLLANEQLTIEPLA